MPTRTVSRADASGSTSSLRSRGMISAMATALHAGRTRRSRGLPSKPIKAQIRQDLREHADRVAQERGISLALYLEELLAADVAARAAKEASQADA